MKELISQLMGSFLVSLPFIAVFILICERDGIKVAAGLFGAVFFFVGCIVLGAMLFTGAI